ncbi:MAG: glycosyltransferase [Sphingomonadales bacterium]|nr:glycosyltransferase [Sphingomonadales bacterium]
MAEQLELVAAAGASANMDKQKAGVPSVSVVIPAYNEQGAVAETIASVREVLDAAGISHEIIVVNDGSNRRHPGSRP